MNREKGWEMMSEAVRLGAMGNEHSASELFRQAALMIQEPTLQHFAAVLASESCSSCGTYVDPKLNRAVELQHEEGCPEAISLELHAERSDNYVDQLGSPGMAG
jgi:hypothetical protein